MAALFVHTGQSGSFTSKTISSQEIGVQFVHLGDVDMDGLVDVLAASEEGNTITWFSNKGDGTFSGRHIITASVREPHWVLTADIDGDGLLDVVAVSTEDQTVLWFHNLGAGQFSDAKLIYTSNREPRGIAIADLDEDGRLDVLVAGYYNIAWFRNEGQDSFSNEHIITNEMDRAEGVVAADIDNDGRMDVLSASSLSDKISWWRNNGSAVFERERVISAERIVPTTLVAADIDKNGWIDVVVSSGQRETVGWFQNMGDGTFSALKPIAAGGVVGGASQLQIADMDNDGNMDLLISSRYGFIFWLRQERPGEFAPPEMITTNCHSCRSVDVADMDGDGLVDVVGAAFGYDTVTWHKNTGYGSFIASSEVNGGPLIEPSSIVTADIDNDGRRDVLSVSTAYNSIVWFRNTATGYSLRWEKKTITTSISMPECVFAADLNNDGLVDVLTVSLDAVLWYANEGDGVFSEPHTISTAVYWWSAIYAADLNRDGWTDVIVSWDRALAWYTNQGNGTFSSQILIYGYAVGPYSIHVVDVDDDGWEDILLGMGNIDTVALFHNEGCGNFSAPITISSVVDGVLWVNAADVDNDGRLDVVCASQNDRTIGWFQQQENGEFSRRQVIAVLDYRLHVASLADLNADGHIDIATADRNAVLWIQNDGAGSFLPPTAFLGNLREANSLAVADFNGDNRLDIVGTSSKDDEIVWYSNQGPGTFAEEEFITQASGGVKSVYAADIDNDGLLDILSASYDTHDIAWFRNLGAGVFSSRNRLTSAVDHPIAIIAADLNSDNLLDILVATLGDRKVVWYKNQGSLGFSSEFIVSEREISPLSIVAADVNQDGRMDIVSGACSHTNIVWFRNEGLDVFTGPLTIAATGACAIGVVVADLDDDGWPDVVAATGQANEIVWYRNGGNGSFPESRVLTNNAMNAQAVHVSDLDNDGRLDVLSASSIDDKIAWYRNEGSGNFSEELIIAALTRPIQSIHVADVNFDGLPDVVSGGPDNKGLAWHRNLGGGMFSAGNMITTVMYSIEDVHCADFNGDGKADVLAASYSDKRIAWFRNTGRFHFSDQLLISPDIQWLESTYAADIDGDGLVDVLAALHHADTVVFYKNLGQGRYSMQEPITTKAYGAASIHAADMDNDGRLDVLVASSSYSGRVELYRNEGFGSFSTPVVLDAEATDSSWVHAADLDNDGCLDVLTALYTSISWYRNECGGNFSPRIDISTVAQGSIVMTEDFDNDGWLDVIFVSRTDNQIAWLRNEGSGLFPGSARALAMTDQRPSFLHLADLDDDGLMDVLCQSPTGLAMAWYHNEGGGQFSIRGTDFPVTPYINAATTADMDNDGLMDIIAATHKKIVWYRNKGLGRFSDEIAITRGLTAQAVSMHALDVDNDGVLDVVGAGALLNAIPVYTWNAIRVDLQKNATLSSCAESYICAAPSPLLPQVWQTYLLKENMKVNTSWHFLAGVPVTIKGGDHQPIIECQTGDSPCLRFEARGWVFIENITFTGTADRFLEASFVRHFHLKNVYFYSSSGAEEELYAGPLVMLRGWKEELGSAGEAVLENIQMSGFMLRHPAIVVANVNVVYILNSLFRDMRSTPSCLECPLLLAKDLGELTISKVLFQGGTGAVQALAVYSSSNLSLSEASFADFGISSNWSVAHFDEVESLALSHTQFENNTCERCIGGAMAIVISSTVPKCQFSNVSFHSNHAQSGGGLAVLDFTDSLDPWRPSSILQLGNLSFFHNSAQQSGGALFWHSATKYSSPSGVSFALQDLPPTLIIEDCDFAFSKAVTGGGAAFEGINILASRVTFVQNEGGSAGGALILKEGSGVFTASAWESNIVRGTKVEDVSWVGGGAVFATNCLVAGVAILHSSFTDNVVQGDVYGGAAFIRSCTLILQDSVVENSVAAKGGALYGTMESTLHLRNSELVHNNATIVGGAVLCDNCLQLGVSGSTFMNNSARVAGGAVSIRNTPVVADEFLCQFNFVSLRTLEAKGGCVAAFQSKLTLKHSSVLSNAASEGLGGNIFLDCSSALSAPNPAVIAEGAAAIGSNVMSECYNFDEMIVPPSLLASGTVSSGTWSAMLRGAPLPLVNSIPGERAVAVFELLDAFGNLRWDDSTTACQASARGNTTGLVAVVLSSFRFQAHRGVLSLHPFSVLASEDDEAVDVSLDCITPATFEFSVSVTVPLISPVITWVQQDSFGYPSERSLPISLQPPLSIEIVIGGVPSSQTELFICSVSSAEPTLGTLIGTTTGTSNATLVTFPRLAVDADLESALPVHVSCQLPGGITFYGTKEAMVYVAAVTLQWDLHTLLLPEFGMPLASASSGSRLEDLTLLFSVANGSIVEAGLDCSVQAVAPNASFVDAGSLLERVQFTLAAPHSAIRVPIAIPGLLLGIASSSVVDAPKAGYFGLQASCIWKDNTVESDTLIIPIAPMTFHWTQRTDYLDAMVNAPFTAALELQWLAFSNASEDDLEWAFDQTVECELAAKEMNNNGAPVAVAGEGRSATWNPMHGSLEFGTDIRLQPPDPNVQMVQLSCDCSVNQLYHLRAPVLQVNFLQYSLEVTPASFLLHPSARSNVLSTNISAILRWRGTLSEPEGWAPLMKGQCSIITDADTEPLGSITSPLIASGEYALARFPNFGISSLPGRQVDVGVECRLTSGGPVITGSSVVQITSWTVEMAAPQRTFRLDEVDIIANVSISQLADILEAERQPNSAYFPPSFTCTLNALNDSSALTYPSNSLTVRVEHAHSPSAVYGLATFRVRLDAVPGSTVGIQTTCEVSGRAIASEMAMIEINEFTGAWNQSTLSPAWLPSSGTFLLPLQPHPEIRFWRSGKVIKDTSGVGCTVTISSTQGEVSLMNPPVLGYAGVGQSVVLDRVLIASDTFGIVVNLSTECTRGTEQLVMPPLSMFLPPLEITFAAPLPPTTIITQNPFSVNLLLLPAEPLVLERALVECTLTCPDALGMSGATASASNGMVQFDSATVTGVIGSKYSITIDCYLGVMELPKLPPIEVEVERCPPGTEPDSSNTQCRACPLNTFSDGGESKCAGCPPAGATCSSGRIMLSPGFYPADTSLLRKEGDSAFDADTNASALLHPGTILYPCWNAEACRVDVANRTYGCSEGYTGPLCGVCDAASNYVRSGKVCTECWPQELNIVLLATLVCVLISGLTYIAAFQSIKKASPRKIVVRITLTYAQMLSSLGLFQAQATRTFREIFGVTETIGGSFIAAPPLQCVLRLPYYLQFSLNMSLPFALIPVCITLAGAVMLIRHTFCRHNRTFIGKTFSNTSGKSRTIRSPAFDGCCNEWKRYIKHKTYLGPMVFVLFLSYNVLSTTAATMFKCRPEVINGEKYLAVDLSIVCYNGSHVAGMFAAGTMALLFNLGMPILLWIFLRRHEHRLHEPELFERFGFLYQGYSVNRRRYTWESVILLRKFTIVMVASTIEDPWYQAIAGISIVVIALVLQALFKPFANDLFNRLETAVLLVLCTTQVISLVYLRSETVPMPDIERSRIDLGVTVVLVALNAAMFIALAYYMLRSIPCMQQCCGCLCAQKRQLLQGKRTISMQNTEALTVQSSAKPPTEMRNPMIPRIEDLGHSNFQAWTPNPVRQRSSVGNSPRSGQQLSGSRPPGTTIAGDHDDN